MNFMRAMKEHPMKKALIFLLIIGVSLILGPSIPHTKAAEWHFPYPEKFAHIQEVIDDPDVHDGDIIILGKLEGEFNLKGALQVAEPASVTGEVKANNITVKGSVEGTITAVDKIHLDPTAKIKGHISSPKISVMDGALFDGEINMSSQSAKPIYSPVSDSSSPPKQSEGIEKK